MIEPERVILKRDALYQQVWAEPVTKVAARYGITGVTLAKICKKLSVPTPSASYWSQRAVGKSPAPAALAPPTPEMETQHELVRRAPTTAADGMVRLTPTVTVAADAEITHDLAIELTKILRKRLRDDDGCPFLARDESCVDVRVSSGTVERAVRLMNALLFALESRGHHVKLNPPSGRPHRHYDPDSWRTVVVIDDVEIEFHLEELSDWVATNETSNRPGLRHRDGKFWAIGPTGKLRLEIDGGGMRGERSVWSDRVSKRVEDFLGDFIDQAEHLAERSRASRVQAEQLRLAGQHENYRRELVNKLWERSHTWNAALTTLRFLDAVEEQYKGGEHDPEIAAMLAFARREAEADVVASLDLQSLKFKPRSSQHG